jgi:hypothetical protein
VVDEWPKFVLGAISFFFELRLKAKSESISDTLKGAAVPVLIANEKAIVKPITTQTIDCVFFILIPNCIS